jgi:phosphorylcholine metabolism protein LicD
MENDPESLYPFGMVFDTHTEYYEPDRKTGIKTSIHIDIWVMDNAPDDDKELRKMFMRQYVYRHLNAGRFLPMFAPPNGNFFRKILAYSVRITMNMIPERILPRNFFGKKLLMNARKYIQKYKACGKFSGAS